MQPQTRKQMIQKIHIGKNELKLDNNAYKMLLLEAVDKPSCSMMKSARINTLSYSKPKTNCLNRR